MPTTTLITHERLGTWARQLRPRLVGSSKELGFARLVETRSTADLLAAVSRCPAPLIVIDVADRPRVMLDELDAVALAAPDALILVLDPLAHAGLAPLARELGATLVIRGVAAPPRVWEIVARWLPISIRRLERSGWSPPQEAAPEPWERLGVAALRRG